MKRSAGATSRPRRAGACICALALGACAPFLRAEPDVPPPVTIEAGAHYAIVCHFECAHGAQDALRAAEAAWRQVAQLFGVDARPETPRPIHLYRDTRDYEAVDEALTGGRLRLNRALTWRGREAHIAVHPNLSRAALAEFGLTPNTLRVIAHEAAHIAARTLVPDSDELPEWLDEGIASSIELDVLIELGLAPSRADEPVSGTRAHLLRERLRRGILPSLERLLDEERDRLTVAERYAFDQHFTDFIRRSPYNPRLLATLRRTQTFNASGTRLRRLMPRFIFGRELHDLAALDTEFHAYLRRSVPGWVQNRRALSTHGDHWLQVGFDGGAEAWRWSPVPSPPFTMSGRFRPLDDGTGSVLLSLQDGAHLAVVIGPDEVRMERFAFSGDPAPRTLARSPLVARSGTGVSFEIRVATDGASARIGSARMLDVRGLSPTGRWGLETRGASNVVWEDIAIQE